MRKNGTERLFLSKLIFTLGIMLVYALARSIPLLGIDTVAYENQVIDGTMLLQQSVGGDMHRYSLMALGISPYMIATILVQVITACKSSEAKSRISQKKMNRLSVVITVAIAFCQAMIRVDELIFIEEATDFLLTKYIVVIEMITGVLVIIWLSERNKRYGIGGQTAILMINILDGTLTTIRTGMESNAIIPILISVSMMFVMLFLENSEKRIPVQRISIHNVYADKNYQAMKINPIGVMPIMFASAAFTLPQLVTQVLQLNLPDSERIRWAAENMTLDKPLGIGVYIVVLYILNISFSFIMLSPKNMTEQFLKSGDSLVNKRPGKETRWYLVGNVWKLGMFSSTIMALCIGTSLYLQTQGTVPGSMAMLPSSLMMLTGLWCNLYRESEALINTDSYKLFI